MLDAEKLKEFYGIDYQSYFLLKEGIKPVIRIGINENTGKDLKLFCKKLGLIVLVKKIPNLYGLKLQTPFIGAYISLSKKLAEEAYEAEKKGDRFGFGRLLGYPDCCINEFIKRFSSVEDLTINSLLKTKTEPSFFCNSIFNFDSKLDLDLLRIFDKNYTVFKSTQNFFLIRHVPCSFDCKESIEIGKKTLQILKREIPKLAEEIVNALKRPLLYFDYFNWILFDGKLNKNELIYEKVLPYESLISKEILEKIKSGNKISISDEEISVFRNDKVILKIPKEDKYKGIIINFE